MQRSARNQQRRTATWLLGIEARTMLQSTLRHGIEVRTMLQSTLRHGIDVKRVDLAH